VNQLAPWIRCVLHDNNKAHRANEALKQLGFAFLSYLEPLPSYWRFFFLWQRESIRRCFRLALLGCSMLQQNERRSRLPG